METHDINTSIIELTGLYDNLNKRWKNDPCATDSYQFFRQEEYRNEYNRLQDTNIESLVLGIVANSWNENILIRLRNLLNENILIYNTRQNDFDSINLQKVYSLHEDFLFENKLALLIKDKGDIQEYPYPTERERQMLLKENQQERNQLENERSEYIRANIWVLENYYSKIYETSQSYISIIKSYFPVEKENITVPISETEEIQQETPPSIESDTIFRTGMFDKFLILEQQLIKDNYLNESLNWVSKHETTKRIDIKSLIIFLVGLLENRYFLPGKDPKIKSFFENRYAIKIGQNFEERRRLKYLEGYKLVFLGFLGYDFA